MTQTTLSTDIIILGGGIVGSVLAKGIEQATSLSATVIESKPVTLDTADEAFDARVIALSKRTHDVLSRWGIEHKQSFALPIHSIEVTDQGHAGWVDLSAEKFAVDEFGQVVSLNQLAHVVQQSLTSERINWLSPADVSDVQRTRESVSVTLSDGRTVNGKLLVMADGGRSMWARSLGMDTRVDDYHQTAVICNVETQLPHRNRAYERFTANGPLALLPYWGGEGTSTTHGYSVVWTLGSDDAQALLGASDAQFIGQLQQAFGYRQGMITKVGTRVSYPLALKVTAPVVGHRAVVVGNAAQALHPIAGQGFNLGLRDVLHLVELLAAQPNDIGAYPVLKTYADKRSPDKQATIGLTDSLVRLFSNQHLPLVVGRNLSLSIFNLVPLLQQGFVNQTMGYGGATFSDNR